jgi:hypothetical protein
MAQHRSEAERPPNLIPDQLMAWFGWAALLMFLMPLPFMWVDIMVGFLFIGLYTLCLLSLFGWWLAIVVRQVRARQKPRLWPRLSLCIIGLIAAICLAPTMLSLGQGVTRYARIEYSKPNYLEIVRGVEAGHLVSDSAFTGSGEFANQRFVVEEILGKRLIGFTLPGGLLDNWSAIVYDPSGILKQTQGSFVPDNFISLFGGTLVSCDHAYGPWWSCGFT